MCGGTMSSSSCLLKGAGLSPRVRGNLLPVVREHAPSGSIPACAGEPVTAPRLYDHATVYPRVCGGTQAVSRASAPPRGLSPRVRGNPGRLPRICTAPRSIPACAGEPLIGSPRGSSCMVYPRVCGGTPKQVRSSLLLRGLSPRVRGNRVVGDGAPAPKGSIPACAGEPGQ